MLFRILFIVLLAACHSYAQDESLFDRINGVSAKSRIYLRLVSKADAKDQLLYSIDDEKEWNPVDDDLVFKIRNQHKNRFKILFEFYNPLLHSVKSQVKEIDDPTYTAISQFFSQLPASVAPAPAVTAPSFPIHGGGNTNPLVRSMLLYAWILELTEHVDPAYIAASADRGVLYNKLVEDINRIKDADNYLFNTFGIPDATGPYSVAGWIKSRSDALFKAGDDHKKFETEITTGITVYTELAKMKEPAEKAIQDVKKLLSTDFDSRIAPFIRSASLTDFKNYSAATAEWLVLNHGEKVGATEATVKKFTTFVDGLNAHLKRFTQEEPGCGADKTLCKYYSEDHNFPLSWKTKTMKVFDYQSVKLNQDGTEVKDSGYKGKFTVGKKLFFYPYVSTALIYTEFSYPNYAISTDDAGVNTVAKLDDTKVYVRPAVYLNFLITSWDPLYPFLQMGISTGVDNALFPVGGGISIGSSFSVSGGVVLGNRKDLNKLKVGQIVQDEATLKNDLTTQGFVKGYFSINYNLGKK